MTHGESRDIGRDTVNMTGRERWAYRIALGSMVVFTMLGVYVLFFPSEGLITLFAIMMLVTLVIGAISGLIAAGASADLPRPPE
jgi:preprotein translocase subunit SecF